MKRVPEHGLHQVGVDVLLEDFNLTANPVLADQRIERGDHFTDEAAQAEVKPTIAEGTAIAKPIRLHEVLGVLRETGGGAVRLSEDEIAKATLDLAHMGLYVEPTAAQPAAR